MRGPAGRRVPLSGAAASSATPRTRRRTVDDLNRRAGSAADAAGSGRSGGDAIRPSRHLPRRSSQSDISKASDADPRDDQVALPIAAWPRGGGAAQFCGGVLPGLIGRRHQRRRIAG
jgi:hypothetical protein